MQIGARGGTAIRSTPELSFRDEPVLLPVVMLRFTHHTINVGLAFGEDHENRQESIFKLFDTRFRYQLQPNEIEIPGLGE
jgi:hypothetical protein